MLGSYPACSSFGEEGEQPTPSPQDAGGDGNDAAGDAPTPPPGCKPTFPNDFATCICDTPAAIRGCDHGATGGKSRCKSGSQSCENGKWTDCSGATEPLPAEVCFDDVDDTCDGKLDDGCKGSPDVEICPTSPLGGSSPIVIPDKTSWSAKDDFMHLFVLWNKKISALSVWKNGGEGCTGGFFRGPVSPGKACATAGWFAGHLAVPVSFVDSGATSENLSIFVNSPSAPCMSEEKKVDFTVNVVR